MRILLTGGTGFIGSHTVLAVLADGHEPILLDNFTNSRPEVGARLNIIAGRSLTVIEGDVRDRELVHAVLVRERVEAVIHFAALKSVENSVADPLSYHANNVGGLISLAQAMEAASVRTIVFSSSATVYGEPERLPIDEAHPTHAINPYGQSKRICENILSDLALADRGWRVSILRYFNPVGAHPSGLIGENPTGTPTNLMPLVVRVARGEMDCLRIYGDDYPTDDSTAVRDYIHVVDLAEGHVAALQALRDGEALQVYNLGTGKGTSVLELITAFERATGIVVPYVMADRRPGDVGAMYAAVEKAERELGWRAQLSIADMCADSWRFACRVD